MPKKTTYQSFAELTALGSGNRDYSRRFIARASAVTVIAPHGGGIEPGTTEIAAAIAGSTFSFYAFEGLKPRGNSVLHITSTDFDDPLCLQLLEKSDRVVAIHGCSGKEPSVYVGGLDRELVQRALSSLVKSGFAASTGSAEYPGEHARNICNRGRLGKGLQLELTEGLRAAMFGGLRRPERKTTTAVFDRFVNSIREALSAGRD